jgi:hypothetical protein
MENFDIFFVFATIVYTVGSRLGFFEEHSNKNYSLLLIMARRLINIQVGHLQVDSIKRRWVMVKRISINENFYFKILPCDHFWK